MRIRIKDIANKANLSQATVSLALNDNEIINIDTRNKIKKIAEEMGYIPNTIARGLAKKKSNSIGIVIPDIESMYYSKIVKHVDYFVRQNGYELILAISNNDPEIEEKAVYNFISQQVEGILIAPINKINDRLQYYKILDKLNIPYVHITAYYPNIESSYSMVDLEKGSYVLVKHLIKTGHKDICFLVGTREVLTISMRIDGYRKAFFDSNILLDENNIIECSKVDYLNAYNITNKIIQERVPDAIITMNDEMALGVINAVKSKNSSLLDEISVAGFDDLLFSKISHIPITTVKQDLAKIAKNGVNILIRKISNKVILQEKILIQPEFIIRQSTKQK